MVSYLGAYPYNVYLFYSGGNAVPIENSDRALATVSKLTAGEYKFRLTVTDEEGLQSSATLTVTVKESKSPSPYNLWPPTPLISRKSRKCPIKSSFKKPRKSGISRK